MKLLNEPRKQVLFVLALGILSVLATYYVGKPAYVGYIIALLFSFIAGVISTKWWGVLPGLLGPAAGFLLLHQIPQEVSKKLTESHELYLDYTAKNYWWMILLAVLAGFLGVLMGSGFKKDPDTEKTTTTTPNTTTTTPNTTTTTPKTFIEAPGIQTRELTMMAMFIALSVAINSMRIGSVSFGGFPIIFSGYVLGPIPGLIVGALADIAAFIIRPSSFGFNPIFTVTSALTGFIPIVITRLLGEDYPKYSFPKVLAGTLVGQLITSVIAAPFFSAILYSTEESLWVRFWTKASSAGIKQAVSVPVYALLIVSIVEAISNTIKVRKKAKVSQ